MRQIVLADDFLNDNYLSTELRVPSTLLQTNVCSPIATNAIAGNIWDNFSSQSYKELPSVGTVKVRHPFTGAEMDYTLPGGGRGFTRPASLVSLWSTAPFLQNNTVGPVQSEPVGRGAHAGVPGLDRADALAGAAQEGSRSSPTTPAAGVGIIDRTTAEAASGCREGYVPDELRPLLGFGQRLFPLLFRDGSHRDRSDSRGHAREPAGERRPPGADCRRDRERARAHRRSWSTCCSRVKHDLKDGRNPFANQP